MQVARLFQRGVRRQAELAEYIGVNRSTISRDLKVLREEWRASAQGDIQDTIAELLEEVQHLKLEYWQAWERSKKTPKGDSRFLTGVERCIARLCALLVNSPVRTEGNGDASRAEDISYPENQRKLALELEQFESENFPR